MIKCIGFLRLLKQLFIILLISCSILLVGSFVNARTYTGNASWLSYQDISDIEYLQGYSFEFDNDGDFISGNSGDYINFLYFPADNCNGNYYTSCAFVSSYGWLDGKLYFIGFSNLSPARYNNQGFIKNFMKVDKSLLFDYNLGPANNFSGNLTANEFYSTDHSFNRIYTLGPVGSTDSLVSFQQKTFCLEEDENNIYCWNCSSVDNNNPGQGYQCLSELENSQNYSVSTFSSFSSVPYDFSPFGSSSNNNGPISYTGTFEDEIDSTIAYYEYRYNWNENMCYVGTNDLEHSFRYFIGQGVPYEFGSGATLYQLYYSIYSGFGNNKIRNLGSFINSWVINYQMVYDTLGEDDIRYVARYNGPDTNVTILYTGYTNELFLGNLGAIYNMASVLYNSYMKESTMGEEVAYYCDIKLNYQNYKNGTLSFTGLQDLVTPGIIERVGDYISRDMPGSTGYIQPDMGSGSIWNDIVSSGYAIPEEINPTNLFKDYYDKMNNLVRNFVPVNGTGIIPDWILFPMLFLIFYRIIRH